jgi:hypothetical protein
VRRAALALAAAGALAVPAAASAAPARVETMVVGKSGVVSAAKVVSARSATVRASGHRCTIGAGTPLAALVARRTPFRVRDDGACSRRAADAGGLYVFQVGSDRARGQAGWVYKVGNRLGTAGAAEPSGPFGTGHRLRSGQRLLWFWCRSAGACQRTLHVSAPARASAGRPVTVTVRGYDDQGRGVAVAGATVTLGSATATTGSDGRATLTPRAAGRARLTAAKAGLVPAFPRRLAIA